MISESLLRSCGQYHSQINSETNTRAWRKLEQKTHVFTDKIEGLHDAQSADSLKSGARCQFLQNIHEFSQESCFQLKLMAQHDKWKSPSVTWWISFPDQLWNECMTTKKTGTEDPCFCRQQRRAARTRSQRVQACRGQWVSGRLPGTAECVLMLGSEQQWCIQMWTKKFFWSNLVYVVNFAWI